MPDFGIYAGDTNKTIYVRLRDSTTGLAKTGLAYNSTGAVCSYTLPLAARAAITLATQTVTGAHSDGGFVEVDATNCKGLYRLDLPDAAIASGDFTIISIEFDGIIEESVEIPLHTRKVNTIEVSGTTQTANDNGADINAILLDTAEIGTAGAGLTDLGGMSTAMKAEVQTEANDALVAQKLDHLVAVADADDPVDDSIIAKLAASDGDWSGFDNTADSLEAIRDRGDAAWTTGGGGSISDILNVHAVLPISIDLADTATVRLGLMLTNALDDLPSTAEITPGTIDIDRKAIGGTSWSSVVSGAACSEQAGMIYYDEVFDSGTGYAEGDSIRVTFKSQKITVSANDYEITDANGVMFQTFIRETMRGTDSAATASALATAQADLDTLTGTDGATLATSQPNYAPATAAALTTHDGKLDTVDGVVDAILLDTAEIGAAGAGLTDLGGMSTAMKAEVNAEADTAISDAALATAANLATVDTVVDAIKVVTDAIPDSGAMSSIAQASALATVDTVVDAIKVITDALGATAAANLALSCGAAGVVTGTAQTGTLSTTVMTTDLSEATDDHYIGRVIIWTSGVLLGQATDITDYSGTNGTLTYTPTTEAPSNNDTFIIV